MGRTKAKRIKRPNGAGSLYQRRDGRWHARYTIVDPETGQRVRRSLYGATEQEARANLTRALDAPGRGGLPLHRCEELLRYALPNLGHLQLVKLEPHHVGTLLTRLRDGGLSARTCNHVRSVLRNLLNQAKRGGSCSATWPSWRDPCPWRTSGRAPRSRPSRCGCRSPWPSTIGTARCGCWPWRPVPVSRSWSGCAGRMWTWSEAA
ncbi:MAG TPA: hypothetical protein VKY90_21030 [Candidatus Dormibacteraeota bacterium]|nr:hypothetical protein [Candidatus Dormibacteraeota bacterium]